MFEIGEDIEFDDPEGGVSTGFIQYVSETCLIVCRDSDMKNLVIEFKAVKSL